MRWEPLLIILLTASLSGLVILTTIAKRQHRWFALIVLGYLTSLAAIVFTPLSFSGTAVYIMPPGIGRVNLTQLDVFNLGFAENILMTLPLGLLLKWIWPRLTFRGAAFCGLLVGGSIETLQYLLSQHWLINRSSDINDVLANLLGVFIGSLLVASYQSLISNRDRKLALARAH